MKVLFLLDMNPKRPWWRERVSAVKSVVREYEYEIDLVDVYEAFGVPELSEEKLWRREAALREAQYRQNCQKNLLKKLQDYDCLLLSTLDIVKSFLTTEFLVCLKENVKTLAAILGDDELNKHNYKSFVPFFDMNVVYLNSAADFYRKYGSQFFVQGNSFSESNYYPTETRLVSASSEQSLVFVGSPSKKRLSDLRALRDLGFELSLYGPPSRWSGIDDMRREYKGLLPAEDFFNTLSQFRFAYCSFFDWKGRLHMNTKIWEAMAAGCYPICEKHPALESQFGLTGDRKLVYLCDFYSNPKIKDSCRVNYEEIRQHVYTSFRYEVTYKRLFERLASVIKGKAVPVSCDLAEAEVQYVAPVLQFGKKFVYPWLLIPGLNIYRQDRLGFSRCNMIEAFAALIAGHVYRTDNTADNTTPGLFSAANFIVDRLYFFYKGL